MEQKRITFQQHICKRTFAAYTISILRLFLLFASTNAMCACETVYIRTLSMGKRALNEYINGKREWIIHIHSIQCWRWLSCFCYILFVGSTDWEREYKRNTASSWYDHPNVISMETAQREWELRNSLVVCVSGFLFKNYMCFWYFRSFFFLRCFFFLLILHCMPFKSETTHSMLVNNLFI